MKERSPFPWSLESAIDSLHPEDRLCWYVYSLSNFLNEVFTKTIRGEMTEEEAQEMKLAAKRRFREKVSTLPEEQQNHPAARVGDEIQKVGTDSELISVVTFALRVVDIQKKYPNIGRISSKESAEFFAKDN